MFLALFLLIFSGVSVQPAPKECITQDMITHISNDWPVIEAKTKHLGKYDFLKIKLHNPSNSNSKSVDGEFVITKKPKTNDKLLLSGQYNNSDNVVKFEIIKGELGTPICYSRNVEQLITMEPLFIIPKIKLPNKDKKK